MKLGLGFCYWTPVRPKINLTSPSPQVIATQPWMKMNNFSMIAEVIDSAPGTNINNKVIFHMGDNSGIANRYVLYKANGDSDVDFYLSNASATVASTTRQWEILRASKKQRWGLSVKNGTIKLYLNGVKIDAWFDISVPTVASPVIGIGTQNSALDYTHANLTYNSFQFYDRALSETKMRQLTTTDDHDTSATYNPALKLIAVGGQSNAGGRASGSNTYTNGARMKLIRTQGGLVSYADPAAVNTSEIFSAFFGDSGNNIGLHGMMLDTLAGTHTSDTFAVHPCAKGGTSLNSNWQPLTFDTSARYQVSDMTYCYLQRLFVARAHAPIAAHVWYQGESDALENVSQGNYAIFLNRLYTLIRETHGTFPLITVSLHDDLPIGTYPAKAAIRAAQDGLSCPTHHVVPALGYATDAGNVHHTAAGYNALGVAVAGALSANVFG